MPESAATVRRSIGDSEGGGSSTAVPGGCTGEAAASDRQGMLGASSWPRPSRRRHTRRSPKELRTFTQETTFGNLAHL